MQAVILAGGLGTRLRPLTNNLPKPMIPVNGKPFLEYEVELLKRSGITNLVLCVGYLSNVIETHFGDGLKFGVKISYSYDGDKPLAPAGALKKAENQLEDVFFVTYGDAYLRLDYNDVMHLFLKSGKLGAMVVYENHNKYGRSDLVVGNGLVLMYNKRKEESNQSDEMVWINYGVSILRKEVLRDIPLGVDYGEEEFYGGLIKRRELLAYPARERFYEIGTKESLAEFADFLKQERS